VIFIKASRLIVFECI